MRILKADFRKREIEDNLLLPKNSVKDANLGLVNGKTSFLYFTVQIPLNEYNKVSEQNQSMKNAYKYRKVRK